jgi:hypothetical protein
LPTPGQTPLLALLADNVRLAEVVAPEVAGESATNIQATIIVAMASGSAVFRKLLDPLWNILTPSPKQLVMKQ